MKKITFILPFLFTMTLLAGCVSIPTGDGNSIKLSKDGVSVKSKDGEEVTIKGDEEGGTISIQGTDADGNEASFNSTSSGEIPDDFPDSIPIPKEAVILVGQDNKIDGSRMLTVAYEVEEDDVAKYGDLYREYAQEEGYEIMLDTDYGDAITFSANRDKETLNLSVAGTDTDITVTVTYIILSEE